MYVSHNVASAASYETAAANKHERPVSKTRAAVDAQLAHNRQSAKVDAANLAKLADTDTAKAGTAAASTAATKTAATTAANANATSAAATTAATKSGAAVSTPEAAHETSRSSSAHKSRHSEIYEKQSAYLQSQAKINAALLSKVASTEAPKAASTTVSTVAADAATNKYMAHAAETQTSTRNITV